MATWNKENNLITRRGEELLAKAGVGEKITLTKVVFGAGRVPASTLYNQTEVTDPKQLGNINRVVQKNNQGHIVVHVNNAELNESYMIQQMGVYASHPETGEVLYLISQAEPGQGDVMPLPTDTPVTLKFENVIIHNQDLEIELSMDIIGYPTEEEFEELKQFVEDTVNTHVIKQKDVHGSTATPTPNRLVQYGVDGNVKTGTSMVSEDAVSHRELFEKSTAHLDSTVIHGEHLAELYRKQGYDKVVGDKYTDAFKLTSKVNTSTPTKLDLTISKGDMYLDGYHVDLDKETLLEVSGMPIAGNYNVLCVNIFVIWTKDLLTGKEDSAVQSFSKTHTSYFDADVEINKFMTDLINMSEENEDYLIKTAPLFYVTYTRRYDGIKNDKIEQVINYLYSTQTLEDLNTNEILFNYRANVTQNGPQLMFMERVRQIIPTLTPAPSNMMSIYEQYNVAQVPIIPLDTDRFRIQDPRIKYVRLSGDLFVSRTGTVTTPASATGRVNIQIDNVLKHTFIVYTSLNNTLWIANHVDVILPVTYGNEIALLGYMNTGGGNGIISADLSIKPISIKNTDYLTPYASNTTIIN